MIALLAMLVFGIHLGLGWWTILPLLIILDLLPSR